MLFCWLRMFKYIQSRRLSWVIVSLNVTYSNLGAPKFTTVVCHHPWLLHTEWCNFLPFSSFACQNFIHSHHSFTYIYSNTCWILFTALHFMSRLPLFIFHCKGITITIRHFIKYEQWLHIKQKKINHLKYTKTAHQIQMMGSMAERL